MPHETSEHTAPSTTQPPPAPPAAAPVTPAPSGTLWEPGALVAVLYYRPHRLPDGGDAGAWETQTVRVVTPGPRVTVVEVGASVASALMNADGFDSPAGSCLRFPLTADLFPDGAAARDAAAGRAKPKP